MKKTTAILALVAAACLLAGLSPVLGQQAPPALTPLDDEQREQIRMKLLKEYEKRGAKPPNYLTNSFLSKSKPGSTNPPAVARPIRPLGGANTPDAASPAPRAATPTTATPTTATPTTATPTTATPTTATPTTATPTTATPTTATPTTPQAQTTTTAPANQTVAQPAQPGGPQPTAPAPAMQAGGATPAPAQPANKPQIIPPGQIDFPAIELSQFLEYYGELLGRTILRPTSLPETTITIQTQTELTLEEAIQALDTILAMNGIAVIPFGEKFVKVVPIASINTDPSELSISKAADLPWADQPITQIVQLEHTIPSEVMNAIQPFAKNQGGIVPLDSSNVLVIRDYASNVKRMLEIIEKVDVFIPRKVDLEVIPIKFALAIEVSSVLSGLTSGGGGGVRSSTSGSSRLGSTAGRSSRTSSTLGNRPGSTSSRVGGVSSRSSSSVRPQSSSRTSTTGGSNFQSRLQQLVGGGSGGGIGGDGELLGEAIILPDERTNALLVFGTDEERELVRSIVEKLDKVQPQVLIEAIIMEVSINNSRNIGVSSAQRPESVANAVGFGGINNLGGLFGSSVTNFPGALGDGFSYFGAIDDSWEVAVQAIATDGRINVLSRPRIQTSHAVEASLFVGDTVPFVTGTFTDITGGGRSQFQNEQVGIRLEVLPLINEDGLVVMDIIQEIAQLGVPTTIDGNEVPTTTERNAATKVAVNDGDTVILGGFISDTRSKSKTGVPWLKDLPLIGGLFRSKSDSSQRVELIVLIRPTVLKNPELAALAAQEARDQLLGVKQAELDIRKDEQKNYDKIQKQLDKQAEREMRREEKEPKDSDTL